MASIALAVLGAAPTIIQGVVSLVHGVEALFGHGNGKAKKAAVISAFQGGVEAYNAVAETLTATGVVKKLPEMTPEVEQTFSALIDAIVAFYNATGIFTHAAPTAKG